jgi:hypothetical protein
MLTNDEKAEAVDFMNNVLNYRNEFPANTELLARFTKELLNDMGAISVISSSTQGRSP